MSRRAFFARALALCGFGAHEAFYTVGADYLLPIEIGIKRQQRQSQLHRHPREIRFENCAVLGFGTLQCPVFPFAGGTIWDDSAMECVGAYFSGDDLPPATVFIGFKTPMFIGFSRDLLTVLVPLELD